MKKIYSSVLMAILAMLMLTACVKDEPSGGDVKVIVKVGDRLPQFTVTTDVGTEVSKQTLAGAPSVIVFFDTECGDCRRALPEVQKAFVSFISSSASPVYLPRLITISRAEGADKIASYWKENQLILPYSAQNDRGVYNLFAGSGIPLIFISDATTTVRTVFGPDDKITSSAILDAINAAYLR